MHGTERIRIHCPESDVGHAQSDVNARLRAGGRAFQIGQLPQAAGALSWRGRSGGRLIFPWKNVLCPVRGDLARQSPSSTVVRQLRAPETINERPCPPRPALLNRLRFRALGLPTSGPFALPCAPKNGAIRAVNSRPQRPAEPCTADEDFSMEKWPPRKTSFDRLLWALGAHDSLRTPELSPQYHRPPAVPGRAPAGLSTSACPEPPG